MSRRDARKALIVALPDSLRKALVRQSEAHVPLAYLVRQTLRRAMDVGEGWETTVPQGERRPILVQLSCEERARLDMWVAAKKVSEEEAILSLIDAFLKAEARKPPKAEPEKRGKR